MSASDNILAGLAGGLKGTNDLLGKYLDYSFSRKLKKQETEDALGLYEAKQPHELARIQEEARLKRAQADYESGQKRSQFEYETTYPVPVIGSDGQQVGTTIKGAISANKFMSPGDKAQEIADQKKKAIRPKAEKSFINTDSKMQETIKSIEELINNKKLSKGSGMSGAIFGKYPASDAYDIRAKINTLKAKTFLDTFLELKMNSPNGASGLGAASDIEGKKLEEAKVSLDPNQSDEQLLQQLKDYKRIVEGSRDNLRRGWELEYGDAAPSFSPPISISPVQGKTKSGLSYTIEE